MLFPEICQLACPDEEIYPFYIALVEAGQTGGGLSNLHIMEMDYADAITGVYSNLDELLQYQLDMDDETDNWSFVEEIGVDYSTFIPDKNKALLLMDQGRFLDAKYELTDCSENEKACKTLLALNDIHLNGMHRSGFPQALIEELENTVESVNHPYHASAQKLLEFWGLDEHLEFLAMPDASGLRNTKTRLSDLVEIKPLSVYPNPAKDEAYINYLLPDGWENASLNVYDPTGRLMISENASSIAGFHEIETSKIHSGIYSIELVVDGIKIATEKLVVLH